MLSQCSLAVGLQCLGQEPRVSRSSSYTMTDSQSWTCSSVDDILFGLLDLNFLNQPPSWVCSVYKMLLPARAQLC